MLEPALTRRATLRRAGAAAVGATASLAGCTAGFEPPAYDGWLPAPDALGVWQYRFRALDLAGLAEHADAFPPEFSFENVEVAWAPATVNWRDVSLFLRRGDALVVEGAFERDAVREAFVANGYERRGEHAGFTILYGGDRAGAAAVGDGALVGAGLAFADVDDPVATLETFLDANAGRVERYREARPGLDAALDALGDGHVVAARATAPAGDPEPAAGSFGGQVAAGKRWVVDGDAKRGRWVRQFAAPRAASDADLRTWVRANRDDGGRFDDWRSFEYRVDGRTAVVDAVADAADR